MKKIKVVYTVQTAPFEYVHQELKTELSDDFFQSCFGDGKESPFAPNNRAVVENRLERILEDLSCLQGHKFSGIDSVIPCEEAKSDS